MKNFGEKGAWAYPGTAQFFEYAHSIPGTGKATIELQIWQVFSQRPCEQNYKSPLKIWEKRDNGRIQGLPNFLSTPYLSRYYWTADNANLPRFARKSYLLD